MRKKQLIEIVKKNKGMLITIGIVSLLTIVLINQTMGIMFKAQLLQDPCSLCDSYIKAGQLPVNLSMFNITN